MNGPALLLTSRLTFPVVSVWDICIHVWLSGQKDPTMFRLSDGKVATHHQKAFCVFWFPVFACGVLINSFFYLIILFMENLILSVSTSLLPCLSPAPAPPTPLPKFMSSSLVITVSCVYKGIHIWIHAHACKPNPLRFVHMFMCPGLTTWNRTTSVKWVPPLCRHWPPVAFHLGVGQCRISPVYTGIQLIFSLFCGHMIESS